MAVCLGCNVVQVPPLWTGARHSQPWPCLFAGSRSARPPPEGDARVPPPCRVAAQRLLLSPHRSSATACPSWSWAPRCRWCPGHWVGEGRPRSGPGPCTCFLVLPFPWLGARPCSRSRRFLSVSVYREFCSSFKSKAVFLCRGASRVTPHLAFSAPTKHRCAAHPVPGSTFSQTVLFRFLYVGFDFRVSTDD